MMLQMCQHEKNELTTYSIDIVILLNLNQIIIEAADTVHFFFFIFNKYVIEMITSKMLSIMIQLKAFWLIRWVFLNINDVLYCTKKLVNTLDDTRFLKFLVS